MSDSRVGSPCGAKLAKINHNELVNENSVVNTNCDVNLDEIIPDIGNNIMDVLDPEIDSDSARAVDICSELYETLLNNVVETIRNFSHFKTQKHMIFDSVNEISKVSKELKNMWGLYPKVKDDERLDTEVLIKTNGIILSRIIQDWEINQTNQVDNATVMQQDLQNYDGNFPELNNKSHKRKADSPTPADNIKRIATADNNDINENSDNNETGFTTATKTIKIPPIIIKDSRFSWSQFQNDLLKEKKIGKNLYIGKKLNDDNFSITTKDMQTRIQITALLKEQTIGHHTYQLEDEKDIKVVIRGLPSNTIDTDITNDLLHDNISVKNIYQMKRTIDGTKKNLPLFIVTLNKKDPNSKKIYNVRYINSLKVTIEDYKKSNKPVQCHRCQDYFHGQSQCRHPPRCVKCAGNHLTKECTKPREQPAKCCHCNGEHPANFTGCAKYIQIIEKIEKTTTTYRRPYTQHTNTHYTNTRKVNSAYSYANAAKQNTQNKLEINPTEMINEAKKVAENLATLITILTQKQISENTPMVNEDVTNNQHDE